MYDFQITEERWRRQSAHWDDMTWFLVMHGFSDKNIWPFQVEGRWHLEHGSPALGHLAIMPVPSSGGVANLADATWLANCVGFDHDSPIGVHPSVVHAPAESAPLLPLLPVDDEHTAEWYWSAVNEALGAAVEFTLGAGTLRLRYYSDEPTLSTDFSTRFAGFEEPLSLYAMASRQTDALSAFLNFYRILEWSDGSNGTSAVQRLVPLLTAYDFGELQVETPNFEWIDAFDIHLSRALANMGNDTPAEVASRLYKIRNSVAHGKTKTSHAMSGSRIAATGAAVPLVKLLARMVVQS